MIAVSSVRLLLQPSEPGRASVLRVVVDCAAPDAVDAPDVGGMVEILDDEEQLLAEVQLHPQRLLGPTALLAWELPVWALGRATLARWRLHATAPTRSAVVRSALRVDRRPLSTDDAAAQPRAQPPSTPSAPLRQPAPSLPRSGPAAAPVGQAPSDLTSSPALASPPPTVGLPPSLAADRYTRAATEPWDAVSELFAPNSLDPDGRDRVRALIKSDDPDEVIAGCRVAAAVGWKTTVQYMRHLVEHEDARVRCAAAQGIGALAGPAMELLLRRLLESDPDPTVREAAASGLAAMAERARR